MTEESEPTGTGWSCLQVGCLVMLAVLALVIGLSFAMTPYARACWDGFMSGLTY